MKSSQSRIFVLLVLAVSFDLIMDVKAWDTGACLPYPSTGSELLDCKWDNNWSATPLSSSNPYDHGELQGFMDLTTTNKWPSDL